MNARRRRTRGQAFVELALALPFVVIFTMGVVDLAQAYRFDVDSTGAARAGMKTGILNGDIGSSVRAESNPVVSATNAWGPEAAGGADGTCTGTSQSCGDPKGCLLPPDPNSTFTANPNQTACFAVETCNVVGGSGSTPYSCTPSGTWNTRPATNSCNGLLVKVVLAYKPYTPLIAQFSGHNGVFYTVQMATGLSLYGGNC